MNKKQYSPLIILLKKASIKFTNKNDYAKELHKACEYIDQYIQKSPNVAKTVFEIESLCLDYDRNINLKENTDRIDSRLIGCLTAIKDLKELQNNPKEYIKDYLDFKPTNSETAYTQEAFRSLKYLGLEKNQTIPIKMDTIFMKKDKICLNNAEKYI